MSKTKTMDLWESVCTSHTSTIKKIELGKRKFSAIDAYSQIMKATELWGPYGSVWGVYSIEYTFPLEGIAHVSCVFKYPGGEFPLSSAISFVTKFRDGNTKIDQDFAKKVETDLLTKSLSRLGFNADVFLGKFDDDQYVQELLNAENLITNEQAVEIDVALNEIGIDKTKFFKWLKIKDVREIHADSYDRVMQEIGRKRKAKELKND